MRVGIDTELIKNLPKCEEEFLKKIASKEEIDYVNLFKNDDARRKRILSLWCVKEAAIKCLGDDSSKLTMKDFVLTHKKSGRPVLKLLNLAKQCFDSLGLKEVEVSISHTGAQAVAIVVML